MTTARFTRFEALGAYLPATVQATAELMAGMTAASADDLEGFTGIRNRRVRDADQDSLALALLAAKNCLARSRYRAEQLDVIVSTSISRARNDEVGGYRIYFEPAFSLWIKRAIGAHGALHFDLSNACAGMMTGVMLLDRMIKAGIVRSGMVVSGECITPIAETATREVRDARDPQLASLTVGDSGAAVIIDRSEDERDRIHYIELVTCAEYALMCLGMPSDQQPGMAMYANNLELHSRHRIKLWPAFLADVLARRGATFASERFDHVIHHQVGTLAMHLFSKVAGPELGHEVPRSLSCVEEYGNTATTSHFVVLDHHLRQGRIQRGNKILFVPAASGIVTGCVSATISSLEV